LFPPIPNKTRAEFALVVRWAEDMVRINGLKTHAGFTLNSCEPAETYP
jgi:hypothetical protein